MKFNLFGMKLYHSMVFHIILVSNWKSGMIHHFIPYGMNFSHVFSWWPDESCASLLRSTLSVHFSVDRTDKSVFEREVLRCFTFLPNFPVLFLSRRPLVNMSNNDKTNSCWWSSSTATTPWKSASSITRPRRLAPRAGGWWCLLFVLAETKFRRLE